jgi:chromosome segregation ATPase
MLQNSEKRVKELENQAASHKERLSSLRKLNTQYESKIKSQGEDSGVNQNEVFELRDKCLQLEMDNRELTKHLKTILDNT